MAAKYRSKWRPPKSLYFRIAGTSEAETSVSGKAERLLTIGEDRKRKLFGMLRVHRRLGELRKFSPSKKSLYFCEE